MATRYLVATVTEGGDLHVLGEVNAATPRAAVRSLVPEPVGDYVTLAARYVTDLTFVRQVEERVTERRGAARLTVIPGQGSLDDEAEAADLAAQIEDDAV